MKQPKYLIEIYETAFFIIGIIFSGLGILTYFNVLKPTAHSMIQESTTSGLIFLGIGISLGILAMALKMMASRKEAKDREIMQSGSKVPATVEKVVQMKSILYGKKPSKKSPYRVYYNYKYKEQEFHGKSHLFWEKPSHQIGDEIPVWVDENGRSFFESVGEK